MTKTKTLNYEGNEFRISSNGQIWKKNKHGDMVLCRQFLNKKTGYLNITVRVDGRYIHPYVHRLVCAAFHPVENWEKLQCDHKDNCRTNNTASNLRFVTRQFNNNRLNARRMRMKNQKRTIHTNEYVKAVNRKNGEIRYYRNGHQVSEALGCSSPLVYMALTGKTPSCYDWILTYVPTDSDEVKTFKKEQERKAVIHRNEMIEQKRRKARAKYAKRVGKSYRPWKKYRKEGLYELVEMTYNEQGEKK